MLSGDTSRQLYIRADTKTQALVEAQRRRGDIYAQVKVLSKEASPAGTESDPIDASKTEHILARSEYIALNTGQALARLDRSDLLQRPIWTIALGVFLGMLMWAIFSALVWLIVWKLTS